MICQKCGKETEFLEADMFQKDGSDEWCLFPVIDHDNGVFLDLNWDWTGYGMTDEEKCESIRCPHCKQYPFECTEVQELEVLREILFASEEEELI